MQVVGGFVRLDPDVTALCRVHDSDHLVERELAQWRKEFLRSWEPDRPELAAASDMVLPQAGLGLVDAERDGGACRASPFPCVEPLLVESVAGLVKHAEEAAGRVVAQIPGGKPGVSRGQSGAERMGGGVDPTGLEVESDRLGDFPVERLLFGNRVIGAGQGGAGRAIAGLGRDPGEFRFERVEEFGELPGGGATFVFIDQRVVGFGGVSPGICFPAGELEDLLEDGRKIGEVGFAACLLPDGLRPAGGGGQVLHKPGREPGFAVVIVAPPADIGGLDRAVRKARGLAIGDPPIDLTGGGEFVGAASEVSELAGTGQAGCGRQEGFLVPREEPPGTSQECDFAEAFHEVAVRFLSFLGWHKMRAVRG